MRLTSWNCRGHAPDRIAYIERLMQRCDILLLQETWHHDSSLHKLLPNDEISILGISGMESDQPHVGRPHGGCALLFHTSASMSISPIQTTTRRLFACTINVIGSQKILLFNAYMPCDNRDGTSYDDYLSVVNDIESVLATHDEIDCVILCGDLNADRSRTRSVNTMLLEKLCSDHTLCFCLASDVSHIDYTYENEASGVQSILDHFCVSENLFNSIHSYETAHEGDNLSDHSPVSLEISMSVNFKTIENTQAPNRPSWHRATADHIISYKERLRAALSNIEVPYDCMHCDNCTKFDVACAVHDQIVANYYTDIVEALVSAAESSIPNRRRKAKAGWLTHVKPLQEDAIFWQRIWSECGKPATGWVSDIRRRTRGEYRRVSRWVLRNQESLSAVQMAEALESNRSRDLWSEVKKIRGKDRLCPAVVDDAEGDEEVCSMFRDKYEALYSSVSYDREQMDDLIRDVNERVTMQCCTHNCYSTHEISVHDVKKAMSKLKRGKSDCNSLLSSDNFVNACEDLSIHLSFLLNILFRRSCAPSEMLMSVLVPIPKNRRKSLSSSNNFRSIAISSIIGKILDNVILSKHSDILSTSHSQFGFKAKHSTTQCTYVLNEIVDYYNSRQTPVYATLLDASRAFDRVHFVKMFQLLIQRGICPALVKFLICMYTQQSLKVRWQNVVSQSFECHNGIKQGAVLSPILFCIYMDELLARLKESKIGCFIGNQYCATLCYADDLTLLAPTHSAMTTLLQICEEFAEEYNVTFNATKSQALLFRTRTFPPDLRPFQLHGSSIPFQDNALHLGSFIGINANTENISKLMKDLYSKTNILLTNYHFCTPDVICSLFKSYCSSFYGAPLWLLSERDLSPLYICYKKCFKRVMRINIRTRSKYIHLLLHQPDLRTILLSRFASFWSQCIDSDNPLVSLCSELSLHSTSTSNRNLIEIARTLSCDIDSLYIGHSSLSSLLFTNFCCNVTDESVMISSQIEELLNCRHGLFETQLSYTEICSLLNYLCIST